MWMAVRAGMSYKYRDGQEKNRLIYARWVLTYFTGVLTAFVAVFLLYFTTMLTSLKQHFVRTAIDHESSDDGMLGTAFGTLLGFNLVLVLAAATMTSYGEPVAAGSGTCNGCNVGMSYQKFFLQ